MSKAHQIALKFDRAMPGLEGESCTPRCSVTGLNVGANNVRCCFPENIVAIELQLDYLQIQCGQEPDFWQDQPDIHDPRLCAWMEFKYPYGKPDRPPVPLTSPSAGLCARQTRAAVCAGLPPQLQSSRHRASAASVDRPPATHPIPPTTAIRGLCDLQAESEGLHAHSYSHPAHCSHSLILKLLSTGGRPLRVIPLRHGD